MLLFWPEKEKEVRFFAIVPSSYKMNAIRENTLVSGMRRFRKFAFVLSVCVLPVIIVRPAPAANAKNIILMISDGAGFTTFDCTSYYEYGQLGQQVYDSFSVRYGCTTYMLNAGGAEQGYDPNACWSDFNYVKGNNDYTAFTDSAAAATAINTGTKTTKHRINTDKDGNRLTTLAEIAKANGKSVGAVSSNYFSHATPAAVWAHNSSRYNYSDIANEMVYNSGLDVIIGPGHPDFDNDGLPASSDYEYVGGEDTWNAIINSTTGKGWSFIDDKSDFETMAMNPGAASERLIGVPEVYKTLQYERAGTAMGNLNANVPDLATIAMAAINVLSKNPHGFYLMIEGGAADWASHDNNLARMIEEQMDFNLAAEAVVNWVDANSSWEDTLVIVTADHETGQLWGPGAGAPANFDLPVNNGTGVLPTATYFSDGHTNALVPLYAKGIGSEMFADLVDGTDPNAAAAWGFSGQYVDNADIFTVMHNLVYRPGDIDRDSDVDSVDLAVIALHWLESDCNAANSYCGGADLDEPNTVDSADFAVVAADWRQIHSLDISVSSSNDDAEELNSNGDIGLTSSDLELTDDTAWHGGEQTIGIRFNNIQIDQAAPLTNAYIQFTVDELNDLNPCSLTIAAQAADDSSAFTLTAYDISSRPVTSAGVAWEPDAWDTICSSGTEQQTPNIASVIQEVVDRPGWAVGNSVVIIITGTGRRVAEAYDGNLGAAPLLHIDF